MYLPGKSTVVKLYRDFLHELNVWPDHKSSSSTPEIVEKTGLLLQRTQDVSDIGEKLSPSDIGTKGGVSAQNGANTRRTAP